MHLVCSNTTDELYSISSSVASPMVIESFRGRGSTATPTAHGTPRGWIWPVADNPSLAYDSYLTIGASHSEEGRLRQRAVGGRGCADELSQAVG